MKEYKLWLSIKKILEDKNSTNEQKLERIETYIEVHEQNSQISLSDVL